METLNFISYLQDEFCRRCKGNSNYSLRAYARNLGTTHGALSEIMRGKRPLSEKTKKKLCLKLNIRPERVRAFDASSAPEKDFKSLTTDAFAVISDWYHYALLELTRLNDFKNDPKWIGKKLGITSMETSTAIMRLKNLGLLVENGGRLMAAGEHTNIQCHEFTDSAKLNFQKSVVQKALDALNTVPITQRNQTSLTFAFNSKRLPEAIEKIAKFRRRFNDEMNNEGSFDTVYNLSLSLYPLTFLEKKNEGL